MSTRRELRENIALEAPQEHRLDLGPQPLACVAREDTIAFEMDQIGFDLLRRGGGVVALKFFEAVTSGAVAVLRKAGAHMARLAPARLAPERVAAPSPIARGCQSATLSPIARSIAAPDRSTASSR